MHIGRRHFLSTMAVSTTVPFIRFANGAPSQSKPRIVLLAHGLFGFSTVGPRPYFNGVKECFDSGTVFHAPAVPPTGSFIDRGKALKKAIADAIPSENERHKAIHIVAHSMGGLDARYLISSKGLNCSSWIASLTTISTPHNGSPIADFATGQRHLQFSDLAGLSNLPEETLVTVLEAIKKPAPLGISARLFAPKAIWDTVGDLRAYLANVLGTPPEAIPELTTNAAVSFNEKYQSLEGVPFLCCAGLSDPGKTMSRLLFPTWAVLKAVSNDNDGVVPVTSSQWKPAIPLTTAPADHLELVGLGQLLDGVPVRTHFNVCDLYKKINDWQRSLPTS
jgi:triacylglycerol lipase